MERLRFYQLGFQTGRPEQIGKQDRSMIRIVLSEQHTNKICRALDEALRPARSRLFIPRIYYSQSSSSAMYGVGCVQLPAVIGFAEKNYDPRLYAAFHSLPARPHIHHVETYISQSLGAFSPLFVTIVSLVCKFVEDTLHTSKTFTAL